MANPMPKICPLISWWPGITTKNNRPNETAVSSSTTDSAPAIRFQSPGGPNREWVPDGVVVAVEGEFAPDIRRLSSLVCKRRPEGLDVGIVILVAGHRLRRSDNSVMQHVHRHRCWLRAGVSA